MRPACCTSYSGAWDGSNLRELLRASAAAGLRPAGLAFGNELVGAHAIEVRLPLTLTLTPSRGRATPTPTPTPNRTRNPKPIEARLPAAEYATEVLDIGAP